MKRLILVVTLFAAISTVSAQDGPAMNAIKLNPLSLIFATGNVSYERAISEKQSAQLGVYYSGMSIGDIKYSGLGITPEFRFYLSKRALSGGYLAPFVRYQRYALTNKVSSNETTFNSIGGGATIGWQKMWRSGFVLDLFAGPAYNSGKFKNDADEDEFDLSSGVNGFGVRTGITLGFGF